MRAIVQRVLAATVSVDGREVGRCGEGLCLLVGVRKTDTIHEAIKLAEKVSTLRIFNDEEGKMNLALVDFPQLSGVKSPIKFDKDVLAVSNFTVYGNSHKSRRPSFTDSAPFEQGKSLFDSFVNQLRTLGVGVQCGEFGAHMLVSILNDGPVTLVVDVEAPNSNSSD
jgi:D-aminoacyl-tRNA deacylase